MAAPCPCTLENAVIPGSTESCRQLGGDLLVGCQTTASGCLCTCTAGGVFPLAPVECPLHSSGLSTPVILLGGAAALGILFMAARHAGPPQP